MNHTYNDQSNWSIGHITTEKGDVPVVSTSLCRRDILGTMKVRLGIGRDNYRIMPGLYAIGNPDSDSPTLVSANYKLTFDSLRKELDELNLWLLILDTDGVNVWCSAGKGTFGTTEVIKRVALTGLNAIAKNKTLILPQLAASGVNGYEVQKRTGFQVVFGPVRASDIKAFLSSGMKATKEMRTVRFDFRDRIVLTPVEVINYAKHSAVVLAVVYLINLFAARPILLPDFLLYCAAILTGTVLTPAFLPFIPGKAFSVKGWLMGIIVTTGICIGYGWFSQPNLLLGIGYMLIMPAISSYLAMNFTGSSTYTSQTGVVKEIKTALPFLAVSLLLGCILISIKTFIG